MLQILDGKLHTHAENQWRTRLNTYFKEVCVLERAGIVTIMAEYGDYFITYALNFDCHLIPTSKLTSGDKCNEGA